MLEAIQQGITYGIIGAGSVIGFMFIMGFGFILMYLCDRFMEWYEGKPSGTQTRKY